MIYYRRTTYIFIFAIFAFLSHHCRANNLSNDKDYPPMKETADSLYDSGNYTHAIKIYNEIIKQQGVSPALYYNLGNSYYKNNDMAHAILSYERGLKLNSSDSDIRHNLSIARSKIQDKNNLPSEFFLSAWWNTFSNLFSFSFLKLLGLFSFTLFLTLLLLYISHGFNKRKYFKRLAILFLFIFIISNLAAIQQYYNATNSNHAIVVAEAVFVKSSPSESSMNLFEIHSGTRLTLLDTSMKEWCEVKYEDGKEGWIEKKSIEII